MNRNKNGVPCCPHCGSTHNYFISEYSRDDEKGRKIIMDRFCDPCQKEFQCIFEMGEKEVQKPNYLARM